MKHKYLWSNARWSEDKYFNAGAYVPDLADAITAVTGQKWTYERERCSDGDGYMSPWQREAIVRSDGLRLHVGRGDYKAPRRGVVCVDYRGSGCGEYVGSDKYFKTSFAHNRDIMAVAKQVQRNVVVPCEPHIAEHRVKEAKRNDTAQRVRLRVDSLKSIPGVQVYNTGEMSQHHVSIGDFRFRVSESGYTEILHSSGDLDLLADLAEFIESRKRQLSR